MENNKIINYQYKENDIIFDIAYITNIGDIICYEKNDELLYGEAISITMNGCELVVDTHLKILVEWNNVFSIEKSSNNIVKQM